MFWEGDVCPIPETCMLYEGAFGIHNMTPPIQVVAFPNIRVQPLTYMLEQDLVMHLYLDF